MTPTHTLLALLGLASSGPLRRAHAVRAGCAWYVRSGSAWDHAAPAQAAALEADRANWTRCGGGWRVTAAPATITRAVGKAELANLIRDAIKVHPHCIRGLH